MLLERAEAYGACVERCIVADGRFFVEELEGRSFESVFLDAPCTGLGTLRRHPEITWKVSASDIAELAALQLELLESASAWVAPSGSLVYSTCSVTQAENEAVVDGFLASEQGKRFSWESGFASASDGMGADAHFCARFRRLS